MDAQGNMQRANPDIQTFIISYPVHFKHTMNFNET